MFRIKTKKRNVSKRVKIPHCRLGIVSYARLSRTFSSLVYLFVTQESRVLFLLLFVCLFVAYKSHTMFRLWLACCTQESHALFVSGLFVTQESRALFFLLFVCLLRENLAHCFFSSLFVGYARISRTVSSLVCLFVTRESRALFLLLFVCLLRKSLVHCFLSCLFVTRESRAV